DWSSDVCSSDLPPGSGIVRPLVRHRGPPRGHARLRREAPSQVHRKIDAMDFSLTEEQQRLVETARKFTREKIIPVAQKLDEHGTFPKEICEQAWEVGLMNAEVPQEYGGLGASTVDHVLMAEE